MRGRFLFTFSFASFLILLLENFELDAGHVRSHPITLKPTKQLIGNLFLCCEKKVTQTA